MKRFGIRTIFGVLAMVALVASAGQAQNVLYNSSFEVSDPLQWMAPDRGGGFAVVSTEQAHTGLSSMKLWGGVPNSIKQDKTYAGVPSMDLDPTKTYQRSVWVYLTNIANPTTGTEIIFMTGLDAGYFGKSIFVTTANQWVHVVDSTPLTGYSSLGMFGVRVVSGADVAYFDDASFAPVPEPASLAGLLTGGLGMLGFAIRRRK